MRVFLLMLSLSVSIAHAKESQEPPRTILPRDIWALEMPGTKDISELATPADVKRLMAITGSWIERESKLNFKDVARPCFAVTGIGQPAFHNALERFESGKKPSGIFSTADEISVVFFSEPVGENHVRIEQVVRKGKRIEIQYRLEPYLEKSISQTFALIPLGKLAEGAYQVEMRQLPRDKKYEKWPGTSVDEEWSRNYLCKAFSFSVD